MSSIQSRRILIVEDDVDIQYLLKCIFESENFIVETSNDGSAGMQRLNNGPPLPDVILLDLMMPVMDGRSFRAAQLENEKLAVIPTIIMTAGRDDSNLKKELKAFSYLQKPVDIEVLLGAVHRAVESYQ